MSGGPRLCDMELKAALRYFTPLLSLAVVFGSIGSVICNNLRIHEHMSPDELRSVFHVDHPSHVPQYHVVSLTHHLSRRHVGSTHPKNDFANPKSKVAHEKYADKPKSFLKKVNPPSLMNDEMYGPSVNLQYVDIMADLNQNIPFNIDNSNSTTEKVSKRTSQVKKNSESDNETTSSDVEFEDLNDEEHILEDQEDGVHKINLEVFGKELELILRKQESLLSKDGLKVWSVVSNDTQPHGVEYLEMKQNSYAVMVCNEVLHNSAPVTGVHDSESQCMGSSWDNEEEIGEMFQDEGTGSALLIRRDPRHGKLLVDGSIGHDMVIRPLPASMSAEQDDEMFLDPAALGDMVSIDTGLPIAGARRGGDRERIRRALGGARHVIIKRNHPKQDGELSDYAFMEPDHMHKRYRRKRSTDTDDLEATSRRRKRDAPYVIYPEILVIVDYDGYRLHGGDNVQIKRYFVSFWNGVDLRYKLLKGPRIRISIAGIIISRGRDATPYLERNRVGRDAIDSAAALTDMGKYLFRERRLPVYDIAVAITKYDMCRRRKGGRCTKGTAGFAYVGGACVVNKRLEKVNSVAIIEDTGGFSGIIVAAHEVGHLLGAVHDGSPPPSYLGGPGAEKCRWEDGFIMSDLRHTEKGFRWSPCSVQSFHHFLNGDTATCLYNSPHEDESLPRVLPGRLLTLDAQCRKDRGTSACFKDERVCAQLFCFDAASGYCVAYRPAAEGSPCGDGQYCINGRCVAEHENIIPDYSQHTPSYVRRDTSPFYGTNATRYEESTEPFYPPETNSVQPQVPINNYYYSQNQYSTPPPSLYNPEHYSSTPNPLYNSYTNYPTVSTILTQSPYKNVYGQSTTKNAFDYDSFNNQFTAETKSTYYTLPTSTRSPLSYNKYGVTSTKSPYDFKDFPTRRTVSFRYEHPSLRKSTQNEIAKITTETSNPFGFFNKFDYNNYSNGSTPRSPYNYNFAFDNSNTYKDVPNNNIKRSYAIGTYYSQPTSIQRQVRVPDLGTRPLAFNVENQDSTIIRSIEIDPSTGKIVPRSSGREEMMSDSTVNLPIIREIVPESTRTGERDSTVIQLAKREIGPDPAVIHPVIIENISDLTTTDKIMSDSTIIYPVKEESLPDSTIMREISSDAKDIHLATEPKVPVLTENHQTKEDGFPDIPRRVRKSVEIEPARLVYSYERSLTDDRAGPQFDSRPPCIGIQCEASQTADTKILH